MFVGNVAIAPYRTPGTKAFAETVLPYVSDHNTVLLANHGIVCWADSVTRAEWYAEVLDTYCWTLMLAAQFGAPSCASPKSGARSARLEKEARPAGCPPQASRVGPPLNEAYLEAQARSRCSQACARAAMANLVLPEWILRRSRKLCDAVMAANSPKVNPCTAQMKGEHLSGSAAEEFPMQIDAHDVLLVIDVQNDFCPGGALPFPRATRSSRPFIASRPQFQHIILTQDWHPANHSSFAASHPGKRPYESIELAYGAQTLWPAHCVQGTRGAEFHPALHLTASRADPAQRLSPADRFLFCVF